MSWDGPKLVQTMIFFLNGKGVFKFSFISPLYNYNLYLSFFLFSR